MERGGVEGGTEVETGARVMISVPYVGEERSERVEVINPSATRELRESGSQGDFPALRAQDADRRDSSLLDRRAGERAKEVDGPSLRSG